jgi:phosphohistidine phosphatase
MTKELLILRHGKSDWSTNNSDFERPLKKRGKRESQRLGAWMLEQKIIPDFILTSPAIRAFATAKKVCKAMQISANHIHSDSRIYMANTQTLKKIIQQLPKQAYRVLIVGHNPGLEELVLKLANKTIVMPEDGNLLPTATLVYFKLKNDFSKLANHSATLQNITRASSLS